MDILLAVFMGMIVGAGISLVVTSNEKGFDKGTSLHERQRGTCSSGLRR